MTKTKVDNLGIPPLAGLCSYEAACKVGYSVDQTVDLLKRYNFVLTYLNKISAAHIPRTPEWEVKGALSLHMWLDAEHSAALRKRVTEMREPPHHLDEAPDERLSRWLDQVIRAENTVELLLGVYELTRSELVRTIQVHLAETNPLADHPTYYTLQRIRQDQEEMIAWGQQALDALAQSSASVGTARRWRMHLRAFLSHAGGIPGDQQSLPGGALPTPRSQGNGEEAPYEMDAVPQRDVRITNSFDQSFSGDVSNALGEALPPDERAFVLAHRRLQEMDVPEWMAPIIYKTRGKPWDYYRDMSRQLWDEARHAMMGEVALYNYGIPFYKYPIGLEGSATLNTEFNPLESHILLWEVEQRLMRRKTGSTESISAVFIRLVEPNPTFSRSSP